MSILLACVLLLFLALGCYETTTTEVPLSDQNNGDDDATDDDQTPDDDQSTDDDQTDDDQSDDDATDDDQSDDDTGSYIDDDTFPQTPDLDAYLKSQMEKAFYPGMAVGIVKNHELVFARSYGTANIEEDVPYYRRTLSRIASVSKLFTSVALMQLVESGQVDLDGDVNDYMPFSVRHPDYPNIKITPRMLMTHTTGIQPADETLEDQLTVWNADSPIPLADYIEGYITPGGAYYSDAHWEWWPPGTAFTYAGENTGISGIIIETVTGQNLDDYVRQHIYSPLKMPDSSFHLEGLDFDQIALPYGNNFWWRDDFEYQAFDHYTLPNYPASNMRSNVMELARFMLAIINGGELDGERILKAGTVQEMLTSQIPNIDPEQCLEFNTNGDLGSFEVIGHGGFSLGYCTNFWFRKTDGVGVLLLSNGALNMALNYYTMMDTMGYLFDAADQF